jgi:hypothetical protein
MTWKTPKCLRYNKDTKCWQLDYTQQKFTRCPTEHTTTQKRNSNKLAPATRLSLGFLDLNNMVHYVFFVSMIFRLSWQFCFTVFRLREADKKNVFSVLKKSERDKKKLLETVLKQLRQLALTTQQ